MKVKVSLDGFGFNIVDIPPGSVISQIEIGTKINFPEPIKESDLWGYPIGEIEVNDDLFGIKKANLEMMTASVKHTKESKMTKKNRREKCYKCKKWFYWLDSGWATRSEDIKCPHCGTVYTVNIDEKVEVWLTRKDRRK